jgi:hypothetical protein
MTTSIGPDVVEHVIGASGEFHLRLPAGEVRIQGTDGETARVRDVDRDSLEDRFEIVRGDGRLSLRVRDSLDIPALLRGVLHRGTADLAVELPRGAAVVVEAASTEVEARGLRGKQRYRTASGDVRLFGVAGTVTIEGVSGDIRIEGDGELTLAGRTVSGDISLRGGRLPSLSLATTSGEIAVDAAFDGPGPYGIQTISGDAVVRAHGGLRVEAKTLTGEIASRLAKAFDSRKGERDMVIGDGKRLLTFKSISGDLQIADSPIPEPAPVRQPVPPAAPDPSLPPVPPAPAVPDPHADARLAILRELEKGTIDVTEAGTRLAALDESSNG